MRTCICMCIYIINTCFFVCVCFHKKKKKNMSSKVLSLIEKFNIEIADLSSFTHRSKSV